MDTVGITIQLLNESFSLVWIVMQKKFHDENTNQHAEEYFFPS